MFYVNLYSVWIMWLIFVLLIVWGGVGVSMHNFSFKNVLPGVATHCVVVVRITNANIQHLPLLYLEMVHTCVLQRSSLSATHFIIIIPPFSLFFR